MNNTIKSLISLPLVLSSVACGSITEASASNNFVGRNNSGYTFTFSQENITTSTDQTNVNAPRGYRITEQADRVEVRANGVVTDLTGKSTHFSGEAYCRFGDSVATRFNQTVHVEARSGYMTPDVIRNGMSYPGKYVSTNQDLGIMTLDQFNELKGKENSQSGVVHVAIEHYEEYDHTDTQVIPGKYINQDNLICQAGRKFNFI